MDYIYNPSVMTPTLYHKTVTLYTIIFSYLFLISYYEYFAYLFFILKKFLFFIIYNLIRF